METKKNTQSYLPQDLIIQILLRLPVISLFRFKCVSNLWFCLINATDFANSHLQITAATQTSKILFLTNSAPHEARSVNIETSLFGDDSTSVSLNPNFMPFQSYPRIEIKGSCRGFILLKCFTRMMLNFYLCNPSTGFHKKIPSSPFASNLYEDDNCFYGFGYDQSTDDYLLVSMSYDDPDSYVTMLSHLEFFSLRANTWIEFEDTRAYYLNSIEDERKEGSFFNGALHWFGFRHDDLEKHVIVSFDLMQRKLSEVHFPDDFDCQLDDCGLWVFGEFLSLWSMNYQNNTKAVEIWVMKEYKVPSSWTKAIVLRVDGIPKEYFIPLCFTKSGYIIGTDISGTGLAKYNDKGQLLEYHSYSHDWRGLQMAPYIESMLSLPADIEQAQ
jgi:F-box interacting protein